jgi:hypothetical protein
VIADVFGQIVFEFLMWPAERLTERLWRLHRKEPTGRRVISAIVLGLLTGVLWLAWIVLLIGIPIAIIVLVAG